MGEMLLKVENLTAAYGGIKALHGVSLEVEEGKIVSVLGANGAGKTTLLKCISSVMKPTGGSISFAGTTVAKKPYAVVKSGLVQAPEGRQILSSLTVYENLMVGAYLRKDKKGIGDDLEYVYSLFPRLKEREKQYGGLLSGGEQQMLAISRAIMAHPRMILLDEPSLGLSPLVVSQIFEILKTLKDRGLSILLVEQNAYKALSISDSAYIMSVGTIVRHGEAAELLEDDSLTQAYLG